MIAHLQSENARLARELARAREELAREKAINADGVGCTGRLLREIESLRRRMEELEGFRGPRGSDA